LLNITSGNDEITIGEIGQIIEFLQIEAGSGANIIWGNGYDPDLGNKISVTIIATGFKINPSAILQHFDYKKEDIEKVELKVENIENNYEDVDIKEEKEVFLLEEEPETQTVEIDLSDETIHRKSGRQFSEPITKPDTNRPKHKEKEKIDNWFVRQFNSFFEENSSELE